MKKRLLALILSCCIVPLAFKTDDIDNAEAASRQLNIITTFDISETATYGVPNAFMSRFDEMTTKVANTYQNNFSITLNFTKPTTNYVVGSRAYECRAEAGYDYDSLCHHTIDEWCNNDGALHHTNYHIMKRNIMPTLSENAIDLHITAVRLCRVKNGSHGQVNGVNFNGECIIVRELDYIKETNVLNPSYCDVMHYARVVAHEIGHSYGVQDHYSSPTDGSPNCIWGYYRENTNVAENLLMCSACRVTIMQNGNKFNHT